MKNAHLLSLVYPDNADDLLLVEALAERLTGRTGVACARLAARLQTRPIAASKGSPWFSPQGPGATEPPRAARRRDGVYVETDTRAVQAPPRTQDEPVPWICQFPPSPGAPYPMAQLETKGSLRDAMEEVDRRFPMPEWWTTLDQESYLPEPPSSGRKPRRS